MNQATLYLSPADFATAKRGGVVTVDLREVTIIESNFEDGTLGLPRDMENVKLNACNIEKNFSVDERRLMVSSRGCE